MRGGLAACLALLSSLLFAGAAAAVAPPSASPGTLYSWGNDYAGELGVPGDNTGLAYANPTVVGLPAGTTVVQVATGDGHGLALTSSGAVYAWGDGNNGDLGQGSDTSEHDTPVEVPLPASADIISVAAGQYVSFAVTAAGQVYAWGDDESGQLGNRVTESASAVNGTPALISGLSGVTEVLTGGQSFVAWVAALTDSGQVYTWGNEGTGTLGNGVSGDSSQFDVTPTTVGGVSGATQIAGGGYDLFAVTSSGAVYGWGEDGCDEIGNNVGDNCQNGTLEATPVAVDFPAGVQIDSVGFAGAGPGHGIASSSTGEIYLWGQGSAYSNGAYYTPTQFAVPGNAPVIEVDASGYCNYALTASGALYANGAYDDSCGFGTSGSSLISPLQAVPIPGGLHVLQFAGGDGWGAAVAGPGLPGVPHGHRSEPGEWACGGWKHGDRGRQRFRVRSRRLLRYARSDERDRHLLQEHHRHGTGRKRHRRRVRGAERHKLSAHKCRQVHLHGKCRSIQWDQWDEWIVNFGEHEGQWSQQQRWKRRGVGQLRWSDRVRLPYRRQPVDPGHPGCRRTRPRGGSTDG